MVGEILAKAMKFVRERTVTAAAHRTNLDWLTALRFFAAFGVLVCHLARPFGWEGAGGRAALFGQFGVDFFFVLSGFVLTWSHRPQRSAARFYWLRFARVWPLHAVVLVGLVVLGARASLGESVAQLLLIQQWNPTAVYTEGINGVSWTLAIEAFFYALFPFLIRWLSPRSNRVLVTVALVWWLAQGLVIALLAQTHLTPAVQEWAGSTNPASRVGQFVAGMVVALLLRRQVAQPHRIRNVSIVWPLASLSVLGCAVGAYARWAPVTSTSVWTWGLTPIMVGVVAAWAAYELSGSRRVPRALVRLGEWSFALYLTHRGVVYAHLLPTVLGWPRWVAILTLWTLALLVSAAAYEWVERPLNRWLRARGPRDASPAQRAAPTSVR